MLDLVGMGFLVADPADKLVVVPVTGQGEFIDFDHRLLNGSAMLLDGGEALGVAVDSAGYLAVSVRREPRRRKRQKR